MINFSLPNISDIENLSSQKDTRKVKSYLTQLTEQLRYILNNIETENFSTDLKKQYEGAIDVVSSLDSLYQFVTEMSGQPENAVGIAIKNEQKLIEIYRILFDAMATKADEVTRSYKSDIEKTEENLTTTFSETYALKTDTTSLSSYIESVLKQTANQVMAIFSENYDAENDKDGVLENFAAQFKTYIRFDIEGIEIGKTDSVNSSPIVARLTNDKLSFGQKGASEDEYYEIAYISNKKLFITEAQVINKLTIGVEAKDDEEAKYLCDMEISQKYGLTIKVRKE